MISNFGKKQKAGPLKQFIFFIAGILILLIIVLLIVANFKIYQKRGELISQIESLEGKKEELEKRNEDLRQGIENVNDEKYIEKIAREELDLQKPGEKVVSFIREETNKPNQENNKNIFQVWLGNISGFWGWVKSQF